MNQIIINKLKIFKYPINLLCTLACIKQEDVYNAYKLEHMKVHQELVFGQTDIHPL